jgi:hypothetical protein
LETYKRLWPTLDGESAYDADLLVLFAICWCICALVLSLLWEGVKLLRSAPRFGPRPSERVRRHAESSLLRCAVTYERSPAR